MERCPCSTPAEMELLDRIERRLENTSPSYRQCRFPAASKRGGDGTRRCDMIPTVAVCVYCSHKIEEKEKSVNLPAGVAHLACAQKAPKGNDPNDLSITGDAGSEIDRRD